MIIIQKNACKSKRFPVCLQFSATAPKTAQFFCDNWLWLLKKETKWGIIKIKSRRRNARFAWWYTRRRRDDIHDCVVMIYQVCDLDKKIPFRERDFLVETTGLEPVTPCMSSMYSSQLSYASVWNCRYGRTPITPTACISSADRLYIINTTCCISSSRRICTLRVM